MFDAGALIYRIQVIGAETANRAVKDQEQALDKAGRTAKSTGTATEELGKKTDETSRKQRQSKTDTEALGGSQEEAAKKTRSFTRELSSLSDEGKKAAKEVGGAMLGIGAAVAAMATASVVKSSELGSELAQVRSLAHANADEMDQLSEAALDMGQNIGLSATEVAQAETELVKAGVSVTDQLGGALPGALNLAAAGQIDVAKSTQIAAVAMTQFKLAGKDVPHLADLLAAGADKALGGVDELGDALNQSGLVASQFGLSVEDTVGTLAAFANAGLLGSDAGTSFKTMLLSLASPSKQAQEQMKQWNIHAYDAEGHFVGITALAGQLEAGLKKATQAERDNALSIIFGTDAIRAANVLYKEGADGIEEWVNKVDDSGFAAEQAQGKLDSLQGDVGKLGAAWDSALIRTGTSANDVLRQMVQILTGAVQWYASLPEPVHTAAFALGVGTAAAALFGGTMLIAVPKVAEFRTAVAQLNKEMPRTSAALGGVRNILMGPWGVALGIGVAAITMIVAAQQRWQDQTSELAETLDEQTGAVTENTRAWVAKQLQDKGIADSASQLGLSLGTITDAALGNEKAMKRVKDATDAYRATMGDTTGTGEYFWSTFGGSAPSSLATDIENMNGLVEGSIEKQAELKAAAEETSPALEENGSSAKSASEAYKAAADETQNLVDQIDQLIAAVEKSNGVGQDAVTSNSDYLQSVEEVKKRIEELKQSSEDYATSIDQSIPQGAANAAMFAEMAAKAQDAAKAQFDLDHNTDAYRTRLEEGRQTLIDQITALTGNRDAASELADQIFRIPTDREFNMIANTSAAARTLDDFVKQYGTLRGTIEYRAQLPDLNGDASGSGRPGLAVGGIMTGRGSGMVQTFASGGFAEHHVAQVARAGAMRVWAEPETGGEAYIPLTPAKRVRSTAILRTVADQFGYQLVPVGAPAYADGSAPAAAPAAADSRGSATVIVNAGDRDEYAIGRIAAEALNDLMRGA